MVKVRGRKGIGLVTCASIAIVFSVGSLSPARAVPLSGFTGNVSDGLNVINYAVLSPLDSNAGVLASAYQPASGNSSFDAGKYTYLYQIANISPSAPGGNPSAMIPYFTPNGNNSSSFSSTTVGSFTSGGMRLDFVNNGAVVNATGNNLQGPESMGIASQTVSCCKDIFVETNVARGTNTQPYYNFRNAAPPRVGLRSGDISPLFGYQSAVGPTFTSGEIERYVPTATGSYTLSIGSLSVPNAISGTATSTSAPEPSTMLLIGSGALGLLAWQRTRRTKQGTLS